MSRIITLAAALAALTLAGVNCGGAAETPQPGSGGSQNPSKETAAPVVERPTGDPVRIGSVLFVRGKATAEGPNREGGVVLSRGADIWNTDLIAVADGGRVTIRPEGDASVKGFVILKGGESCPLWTLGKEGGLAAVAGDVASAIANQKHDWEAESAAAFTRGAPGAQEGQPELLSPRTTVRQARPRLVLRKPVGVARIAGTIQTREGRELKTLVQFESNEEDLAYPGGAPDLPREKMIFVTLTGLDESGGETGRFKTAFRVLGEEACEEVAAWLETLDALRDADPGAVAVLEAGYFHGRKLYLDAAIAGLKASNLAPQDEDLARSVDNLLGGRLKLTAPGATAFKARFE